MNKFQVVLIQKNEIKNQIANLKKQITQINKEYSSKTIEIEEEIKNKYNYKIKELQINFQDELANLDLINNQINTLKEKEKNVQIKLKSISKEITKALDQRDHTIKSEINKSKKRKKKKIKEINERIKVLKKKL
ncbi:MAG: hypothetical protein ACFFFT_09385 [Candidatus Thorarchaeota archaeon]